MPAVTKMAVYTLARFLPLGRLGAPKRVPRIGHKVAMEDTGPLA